MCASSAKAQEWHKVLSCDNGSLVIDFQYDRPLRQAVINDANIASYFNSLGLIDPTPGVHGAYYDGVPLKQFMEYPGKMIFETYGNDRTDFVANGNLISDGINTGNYEIKGFQEGRGYKLIVYRITEYWCMNDVDGYPVCYGGKEEVGNWYFQTCN